MYIKGDWKFEKGFKLNPQAVRLDGSSLLQGKDQKPIAPPPSPKKGNKK